MNHLQYIESRDALINAFSQKFEISNDETLNGQFNMVSASLLNYLPSIGFTRHEDIFKKILLHKKLSILEQSSYEVLNCVETEGLDNEILSLLKNKPTIICTFHTGSYRIINLFLSKNNIPYSLVIGKTIIEKEGEVFSSLYNSLTGKNSEEKFRLIDAEASNSGLQMLRELKKGRSLVLYIDGNTGAGTATTKNDNRCAVSFLHQQIFARKGISFLAHAANVPILTVASYRQSWESIRLNFFDPIYPDITKDRAVFAEETTQQIYNLISPVIKEYPEQWEAWLYIHKVANIIKTNNQLKETKRFVRPSEQVAFNSSQFGIFKLNSVPFLLRKNTYSFYEIDNQLYDLLAGCNLHPVKNDSVEKVLFSRLHEEGVIMYV